MPLIDALDTLPQVSISMARIALWDLLEPDRHRARGSPEKVRLLHSRLAGAVRERPG